MKRVKVPVKKIEGGYKAVTFVMSEEDFDIAVASSVDWLKMASVEDTEDNQNVRLVWDQKRQMYKLVLILKEFRDGKCRQEKSN